jgi:hypothetical protein
MRTIAVIALYFEDHGKIIAQALQFDICAQGESISEATERLRLTIETEMDLGNLFKIGPAPYKFFALEIDGHPSVIHRNIFYVSPGFTTACLA